MCAKGKDLPVPSFISNYDRGVSRETRATGEKLEGLERRSLLRSRISLLLSDNHNRGSSTAALWKHRHVLESDLQSMNLFGDDDH